MGRPTLSLYDERIEHVSTEYSAYTNRATCIILIVTAVVISGLYICMSIDANENEDTSTVPETNKKCPDTSAPAGVLVIPCVLFAASLIYYYMYSVACKMRDTDIYNLQDEAKGWTLNPDDDELTGFARNWKIHWLEMNHYGYLFGVFSVLGVVTAIPTVVMYTDASCYKRAMPASYTITGLV